VSQSDPASNTALVRRYVAAVNAGDLDAIEGLFEPDYVNHRPTGPETGQRAMREFVAAVRRMLTPHRDHRRDDRRWRQGRGPPHPARYIG
jgi:ketosteroid isomerase-like protein